MKIKVLILVTVVAFGFNYTFAQGVPKNIPTSGLVGWWPFTGNLNDSSNNNNHGASFGGTFYPDRFNKPNMAYRFNGLAEYARLGPSNFTAINNLDKSDFTISYWFNVSEKSTFHVQYAIMNFGWGFRSGLSYDTIPFFSTVCNPIGSQDWYSVYSNKNISMNSWHHIVCVHDSNRIETYLDGILTGGSLSPLENVTGEQLYIGGNPIDNHGWFNGLLDDIGIWNRALTKQEIGALYGTVGINELSKNNLFSVYPNPTKNQINVTADINLIGSIYKVYNNIGKLVLTGKLENENTIIELTNLPGGIYLFSVGENVKQTFKVVIE